MSVSISRVPTDDEQAEGCWAEVLQTFGLRRSEQTEEPVRVLVQPLQGRFIQGEQSLVEFQHPEHARYIFGPDHGHLEVSSHDVSVYIPTPGNSVLWSHQAAAIVLYDRMVKRGD